MRGECQAGTSVTRVLIACLFIACSGCHHDGPTFEFVISDGFKGLLLVSEDPVKGVELSVTNKKCVLNIPENGHLFVKSSALFYKWHRPVARYRNGTEIPFEYNVNAPVSFYSLDNSPSELGQFYFVGTFSDYDRIQKTGDLAKMPLGKPVEVQPK